MLAIRRTLVKTRSSRALKSTLQQAQMSSSVWSQVARSAERAYFKYVAGRLRRTPLSLTRCGCSEKDEEALRKILRKLKQQQQLQNFGEDAHEMERIKALGLPQAQMEALFVKQVEALFHH